MLVGSDHNDLRICQLFRKCFFFKNDMINIFSPLKSILKDLVHSNYLVSSRYISKLARYSKNIQIILLYPLAGLFYIFFMFWLHSHLPAKQALNSKQSAKGFQRIIGEILRRSATLECSTNLFLFNQELIARSLCFQFCGSISERARELNARFQTQVI